MRKEDWQTSDSAQDLIAHLAVVVNEILGRHGEGIVEHKQGRLETELVPPISLLRSSHSFMTC
jgi:hypothetical protein